jgi:hypothetical protein
MKNQNAVFLGPLEEHSSTGTLLNFGMTGSLITTNGDLYFQPDGQDVRVQVAKSEVFVALPGCYPVK